MSRRFALAWLIALPIVPSCSCEEEPILTPFGRLQGKACNPLTGAPEDGTVVKSTFLDPNTLQQATSKVDVELGTGVFQISLPTGPQTFSIENGDKFKKSYEIDITGTGVTPFANTDCFDIAPEPGTGDIVGQVCNRHTGSFVTEAVVTVLLSDGTELSATTDADGNFRLESVPAGTHVVYVRATGFQKTYSVTVVEDEQTELEPQTRDCAPPDPSTTAKIVGTICAQDPANPTATSGEPLAGARVYVTDPEDGFYFEDQTLEDGSFEITGVPIPLNGSFEVTVRAEKGTFSYQWPAKVLIAQTDPASPMRLTLEDECQPLQPDGGAKYLVVNGYYDKIQNTLARMNLPNVEVIEGNPLDPTTHWANSAFGDYERMNQYDAIFVNCGVDQLDFQISMDPAVKANLRQYVQQGGSLYVSDWAYDLVEKVWPEKIDFYGDDSAADEAEHGADGSYVATVVNPDLQLCLEAESVTIDYRFLNSALVKQVVSDATIYLKTDMGYQVNGGVDTLEDMPITVGFQDGPTSGRVVFTSFHLESNGDDDVEVLDGPEDKVLRCLVTTL